MDSQHSPRSTEGLPSTSRSSSEVRSALHADVAAIGAIAAGNDMFAADLVPAMVAGYLEGTRSDLWFVSIEDDQVTGFAFCERERMTVGTWNLLAIDVRQDRHSEGIGSQILAHLEANLRRSGERILIVETLGTPAFEKTRNFYHARSFSEEARIRDFYEDGGDKVVFRKRL